MKILVTAGGTREHIDDVRVLTNISKGTLPCGIAEHLINAGHDVIYVHGRGAKTPGGVVLGPNLINWRGTVRTHEVQSVTDLMGAMEILVPQVDAVIHAMAVSDFTFERGDSAVKLKSSDMDGFIEYMRANIRKAPKVLQHIKGWNPDVILVSFKFEVGLSKDALLQSGLESLQKARGDFVWVNDLEEIRREQGFTGCLLTHLGSHRRYTGVLNIARAIEAALLGEHQG